MNTPLTKAVAINVAATFISGAIPMEEQPRRAASLSRPRLLFLCQTLPFPPDNGVNVRSYNTLKLLTDQFEVTSLFFFRRANRPAAADVRRAVDELGSITAAEAFPIPQEHARVRLALDHARSVFERRPYTYYAYRSRAFRDRITALLRTERFDIVHLDSLDLSAYLPLFEGTPVACTHHNVESQLLRRRATALSSPILRRYVTLQAGLTETEERRWCPQVAVNVTVSDEDRDTLRGLAPSGRFIVVPNGVDTGFFQPQRGDGCGVVFVGGYDWFPNRDAMEYFAESILGPFRRRCPRVPVTWVGKAPADARERFERDHGIRMLGFVEDLRPLVADAACFIAPLRVGGGTRLKLVEGMAMGKAIVTTSQGCEGLHAVDGVNMLVRDDPAAFAEAMERVVGDPGLRDRLGLRARETAVQRYDWQVVGKNLTSTYREIVADSRGRPTEAGW